jgi:hypothetical protein
MVDFLPHITDQNDFNDRDLKHIVQTTYQGDVTDEVIWKDILQGRLKWLLILTRVKLDLNLDHSMLHALFHTGNEISNKLSLSHIRNEQPVAGSGDCYIDKSSYLILGPDARLKLVEAHQENAGVIEPLGAVNG